MISSKISTPSQYHFASCIITVDMHQSRILSTNFHIGVILLHFIQPQLYITIMFNYRSQTIIQTPKCLHLVDEKNI